MHDSAALGVRHIVAVLAVARLRSISKAAQEIALSQSQTSRVVAEAERILGARLFRRTSRGIELTDAGEEAVAQLATLPAEMAAVSERVRRAAAGRQGPLRIGYASIAYGGALPRLLDVVALHLADARPTLMRGRSGVLVEALRRGDLDLALLHPPEASHGLLSRELPPEPVVVVAPAGHPGGLAELLRDLPMLVPPKAQWPGLYAGLLERLSAANLSARFEEMELEAFDALALVGSGFGVSLLPASLERIRPPGVRFVAPPPGWDLAVPVSLVTAVRSRSLVRRLVTLVVEDVT